MCELGGECGCLYAVGNEGSYYLPGSLHIMFICFKCFSVILCSCRTFNFAKFIRIFLIFIYMGYFNFLFSNF